MARPIRFQYPGAIYHMMARGDGGEEVFETDLWGQSAHRDKSGLTR